MVKTTFCRTGDDYGAKGDSNQKLHVVWTDSRLVSRFGDPTRNHLWETWKSAPVFFLTKKNWGSRESWNCSLTPLEILILSFSDKNRPFQRQKYEIKVWKNQFVVNFHTPGSSLEKKSTIIFGDNCRFFSQMTPRPPLGTGVLDLFIRKRKKRSYVLWFKA